MNARLGAALLPFALAAAAPLPVRPPLGLDMKAFDRSVAPGDDFFHFANGTWLRERRFAADESYVGARASLIAQRKARVRALIESAANTAADPAERLIGGFYASYLDQPRIDAAGLAPLAADLAAARAVRSYDDLFAIFARGPLLGLDAPLNGYAFYDFHNAGWVRYTLAPGGLGLESRDLYLDPDAHSRTIRAGYQAYVSDMLRLAGETEPDARAAQIVSLETRLARLQWPTADQRDFVKTANNLRLDQVRAIDPDFDWPRFLREAGVDGVDQIVVTQPNVIAPLIQEIRRTPLDIWRAWLVFHLVSENAAYLAAPVQARAFVFERALSGQEASPPRWQTGVDLVERFFGQAVGRVYVKRWFPERNKQIVSAMFDNIRDEMRARIVATTWMSEPTRAEALRKIDKLVVKIGYPDIWPPLPQIRIDPKDFYGNLRRARAWLWADRMRTIRQPLDLKLWQTTPQSSGAAANPSLDEITVPAGALEPPYFDPDADPAVNYGAIGGVLGHELSHMFDQIGRQIDADGRIRDWWAPADAARYQDLAKQIETQYSAEEVLPGLHVDGRLTVNENIADISGLSIALGAWRRSLHGREAAVRDGLSGEQRLFLGWAQMRAGKMREGMQRQQIAGDPHAPDALRVNGVVRNIDAWYEAFGVTRDNRLYLAPDRRVHLW